MLRWHLVLWCVPGIRSQSHQDSLAVPLNFLGGRGGATKGVGLSFYAFSLLIFPSSVGHNPEVINVSLTLSGRQESVTNSFRSKSLSPGLWFLCCVYNQEKRAKLAKLHYSDYLSISVSCNILCIFFDAQRFYY